MTNATPPPVEKSPPLFMRLYRYGHHVLREKGEGKNTFKDECIAKCNVEELGMVAARRYAKLFALAPELYEFVLKQCVLQDEWANDHLKVTGSYAAFDNPAAVREARELIARIKL